MYFAPKIKMQVTCIRDLIKLFQHNSSNRIKESVMNSELESSSSASSVHKKSKASKLLKVEWLGQTIASLCWVVSMFIYGLNSTGDWLQLAAGLAWFIANIASLSDS